jgi:hypothetical protein
MILKSCEALAPFTFANERQRRFVNMSNFYLKISQALYYYNFHVSGISLKLYSVWPRSKQ